MGMKARQSIFRSTMPLLGMKQKWPVLLFLLFLGLANGCSKNGNDVNSSHYKCYLASLTSTRTGNNCNYVSLTEDFTYDQDTLLSSITGNIYNSSNIRFSKGRRIISATTDFGNVNV